MDGELPWGCQTSFLDGRLEMVYADETRPTVITGARLTAWELIEDNIPVTLITDNMATWVMQTQHIDSVIVGADELLPMVIRQIKSVLMEWHWLQNIIRYHLYCLHRSVLLILL